MTSSRLLVLSFALLLGCSACNASITFGQDVEAAGELVTVPFDLDGFDSIDISNTFDVTVEIGEPASVELFINEDLIDELDVRVRNDELRIGLKNGISVRNGTLEATVRMPAIEEIEVSGASETEVSGLAGTDLRVEVSGSSDLVVSGSGSTVNVDASGASQVDLRLDDVEAIIVDLSGASSLEVQSAKAVRGDMSGASSLLVPRETQASVDTSGASSISRR